MDTSKTVTFPQSDGFRIQTGNLFYIKGKTCGSMCINKLQKKNISHLQPLFYDKKVKGIIQALHLFTYAKPPYITHKAKVL